MARIAMHFCQEFNFNIIYLLSPKVIDVSYEIKYIIFSENIHKLHSKFLSWLHKLNSSSKILTLSRLRCSASLCLNDTSCHRLTQSLIFFTELNCRTSAKLSRTKLCSRGTVQTGLTLIEVAEILGLVSLSSLSGTHRFAGFTCPPEPL